MYSEFLVNRKEQRKLLLQINAEIYRKNVSDMPYRTIRTLYTFRTPGVPLSHIASHRRLGDGFSERITLVKHL